MEKYGFVYIWYDRKKRKYYIGRHWGATDDGYVCSSNSMREAHRRRENDFRRKVISFIYTSMEDLITEEQKWLDMIPKELLGKKYYNKTKKSYMPSTLGYKHSKHTKEKIGKSLKGRKYPGRNNSGCFYQGAIPWNKGLTKGDDPRLKYQGSKTKLTGDDRTEAQKLASIRHREYWKKKAIR